MSSANPPAFCRLMASRIRFRPLTSLNTSTHWSSSTCRMPFDSLRRGGAIFSSRLGMRAPTPSRTWVVSPLPTRTDPFLPCQPLSGLCRPSNHAATICCSRLLGSRPVKILKSSRTAAYLDPYFDRKSFRSLMIPLNSSTKSADAVVRFIPWNRVCIDASFRRTGTFAASP